LAYSATLIYRQVSRQHHDPHTLTWSSFSRNFGGFTGDEFFDVLIGMTEIQKDDYLLSVLWKYKGKGGFEYALAEVQSAYQRNIKSNNDSLHGLQSAISRTFKHMNDAFFDLMGIEFQANPDLHLRTFLFKFDAIFTLNQDILLEHQLNTRLY